MEEIKVEEAIKLPLRFENNLRDKYFSDSIVYKENILKEFFKRLGDYKGPFRKSTWVTHQDLITKCKIIGVEIYKNKRDKRYYIHEEKKLQEPVLFDSELLDIPSEN